MKDGSSEIKSRIVQYTTYTLLVVIVIGGLMLAYPRYRHGQELDRKDRELAARIAAKQAEIEKYRDYQRRFKTDREFVESIARGNRRVFPGELVFIFSE